MQEILSGAIVLLVAIWLFFAVSYLNRKNQSGGSDCKTGGCDGNCAECGHRKR